jgi:hypothetical protein
MLDQQKVGEDIKAGVERLIAGKMDEKTFKEWLKQSNATLDQLKVEKKRSEDFWHRYNSTCYY